MKPSPDDPAPSVGDAEIGNGGPSQEVQRHRDPARVGDREDKRHRPALTGSDRCLECDAELWVLRRGLSGC
jgi:hypothetical protein